MAASIMFTLPSITLLLIYTSLAHADIVFQPLGKAAYEQTGKPEWNLSIEPDGTGLPAGSGSAIEGEALFNQHCASCHGFEAIGASAMPLAGEVGSLSDEYPEKTVNSYWPHATTLFDYIRRSMPPDAPYSLTSNEIYTLTAYILSLDGIIAADVELNADTLPKVVMPNREGFSVVYPE